MPNEFNLNSCPVALQDNAINASNHLKTIAEQGLGPADPTQPSTAFWQAKAQLWGISEGDARARLCANCEHYICTTEIQQCIDNGPAKSIKASSLPLTPKWKDVESKPVAFCSLFDITCSPLRTCNQQELGGPIDDLKFSALKLSEVISKDEIDAEEILSVMKSSKAINKAAAAKGKPMPYSYPNNVPTFAKNKKADLQKRVIQLFNETLARTDSEDQARRAALAFMSNYEAKYGDATDKRLKKSTQEEIQKSLVELIKSKYNLDIKE